MVEKDLIRNGEVRPTYQEIAEYFDPSARMLWLKMNDYIQLTYDAAPKLFFSKCAAQPGWNLKYQRSGKPICTLYPGKSSFIILIVVGLDLVPVIESVAEEMSSVVMETVRKARPFNGTKWLMIPVQDKIVLENVQRLLLLKYPPKKSANLVSANHSDFAEI